MSKDVWAAFDEAMGQFGKAMDGVGEALRLIGDDVSTRVRVAYQEVNKAASNAGGAGATPGGGVGGAVVSQPVRDVMRELIEETRKSMSEQGMTNSILVLHVNSSGRASWAWKSVTDAEISDAKTAGEFSIGSAVALARWTGFSNAVLRPLFKRLFL